MNIIYSSKTQEIFLKIDIPNALMKKGKKNNRYNDLPINNRLVYS